MSAKKVGNLIKDARTKAGLSQQKLSDLIPGLSATDISKAERGEKELTTEQLKSIARITGVTQKSLLDAAKGTSSASAKKPASSSTSGTSMKVTAAERKLIEQYRLASSDTKKAVTSLLKGETNTTNQILQSVLQNAVSSMMKK